MRDRESLNQKEPWPFSFALRPFCSAKPAVVGRYLHVFDEYREEYEKAHDFTFDDYIKMCEVSYDADEFERVKERFEEEYFKDLSEDDETR